MNKEPENEYDVIVIGAGIGGLVCAALLAKNGLKTLVLEQQHLPGGYCTSFKRKEFTFNAAVHFGEDAGENGQFFEFLKELRIEREVEFNKLDPLYKVIYPDESISVPADLGEYIGLLSEKFPDEKENIPRFFNRVKGIVKEVERLPSILRHWDFPLFPIRFPLVYKYYKKTFDQLLVEFFKDAKLKSIISAGWPYGGLPPSRIAALYMCKFLHSAHVQGFYYPKGGAQSLANALAKAVEKHGGTLRLKTKATKILVERNKVAGVETSNGERIGAKHIVSNADARQTFLDLIGRDKLSSKFLSQLNKMEPSISFFQVWLGIDKDPRTEGINNLVTLCYPSYDIDSIYDSYLKKEIGEGYEICIPSLVDPDLAPDGKYALSIGCPISYDFKGSWQTKEGERGEEYRKLKNEVAEKLIKNAERVMPGLSEHIVLKEAATPLTFERFTSNYKGAALGWAQLVGQSGKNRLQPKSPIKGLYLTGHWTTPGGGTLSVAFSGKNTAKLIIGGRAFLKNRLSANFFCPQIVI
jgi:prolycopene isomerase